MVGRISNFEIYGDDPEKLAAFYSGLFGWRVEKVEGVSYWRIGIDGDSAALTTGGIAHRPSFGPQGWMNFVEVASLDEALAAVARLGGTVLKPKTAVPRTAWHARPPMRPNISRSRPAGWWRSARRWRSRSARNVAMRSCVRDQNEAYAEP